MLRSSRCPHCKKKLFDGYRIHPECVEGWLQAKRTKDQAKAKRAAVERRKMDRAQDRARRRALETIPELKEAAQKWFRKFIRLRDRDLSCVSCGVVNPPMTVGGQWDAGHFLSRGSHPELAFDEDNCHKQCKSCNGGGGKYKHKERTVTEKYEEELLRRIGPERLARLRGPHPVKKWQREELIELEAFYKARCKELEKT